MQKNDIVKMLDKLETTNTPLVRKYVEEAMLFFEKEIRTNPFEWINYFRGD